MTKRTEQRGRKGGCRQDLECEKEFTVAGRSDDETDQINMMTVKC